MKKKNVELLAPAGNMESFKAAVNAGADAIYMGLGKHNARVMAKNFTTEDYIECIDYAHIREVKVYLTLNTLLLDNEIKDALEMLVRLYEHGLDAVIVQDIGLATLIHKTIPNLPLHASTQMSAYSLEQVEFLKSIGFKRVVLARELTLEEIKNITSNTDVEIEVFIHGALCVSMSGQCLLSLKIGNRSANRGACAQPCRMKYLLLSENKVIEKHTYILSKKDIFTLDILKDILNSNIASLKIEGRNKTPEYVAMVVSTYRKYIDLYNKDKNIDVDIEDEKNLLQVFNRSGKSSGYFKGVKYKDSITRFTPKNTGLYLGKVLEKKGKLVKVKLEENIGMHDGIEIYSSDNTVSTIVTCIKNTNMQLINENVEKGNIVYIGDIKENVKVNDSIYKTSSYKLNLDIQSKFIQKQTRKHKMILNVTIKENSPITLSSIVNNEMYIYNTNIIPQKAINKELTLDDIYNVFSKTQDNGIRFEKVVGYIEKGVFVKISDLNEIRRNFVSKIESKYCINNNVEKINTSLKENLNLKNYQKKTKNLPKNILSIYKYNDMIEYDKEYEKGYNKKLERIDFQINDYVKNEEAIFHKYSRYNLGVNISNFVLDNMDKYINSNLEKLLKKGVKTIVLGSFRYLNLILKLKEKYEFTLVADYSFNITNSYSATFLSSLGFDVIVPAFDATNEQINILEKYVNIELIDNYVTVMTSRYCILGSFVENRKDNEKCSAPCTKKDYYLLDTYNERYDIVCDNIDCIMKILKKHQLNREGLNKSINNIRKNRI